MACQQTRVPDAKTGLLTVKVLEPAQELFTNRHLIEWWLVKEVGANPANPDAWQPVWAASEALNSRKCNRRVDSAKPP